VYIWRENSIRSTSGTVGARSRVRQSAAPGAFAAAAWSISTGVMPVLSSSSATAPLSMPSIRPLISSPRALRPV
jgi:hypothetical protein